MIGSVDLSKEPSVDVCIPERNSFILGPKPKQERVMKKTFDKRTPKLLNRRSNLIGQPLLGAYLIGKYITLIEVDISIDLSKYCNLT